MFLRSWCCRVLPNVDTFADAADPEQSTFNCLSIREAYVTLSVLQLRGILRRDYYTGGDQIVRIVLYQIATLPVLLASLSLRGHFAGGLNWLAAFVVLSLIVALFNAWVLLVEILR